jgi:hypothetical protein
MAAGWVVQDRDQLHFHDFDAAYYDAYLDRNSFSSDSPWAPPSLSRVSAIVISAHLGRLDAVDEAIERMER